MGSVRRPCWPSQWSDLPARSETECLLKKSGPIRSFVPSSATAFAPFSQNSAKLRCSSGFGHAQLWQSKPSFWFSLRRALIPRTAPISPTVNSRDFSTAGSPAAALLARPKRRPLVSTGGCAAGGVVLPDLVGFSCGFGTRI